MLGLDLCAQMIEAARELQSRGQEYRVADVQDLSALGDETFDLAVSYLNHCDLPDFEANAFIADQGFQPVKLSDYKGKWIVLCFYPGDFTFV